MSNLSPLLAQKGDLKAGTILLVVGNLKFAPLYVLSRAIREHYPEAILLRQEGKEFWSSSISRIFGMAKSTGAIGVVFYDVGGNFPLEQLNLNAVRELTGGDGRFDVILLVKSDWPPCELEVVKARDGAYGKVVISA